MSISEIAIDSHRILAPVLAYCHWRVPLYILNLLQHSTGWLTFEDPNPSKIQKVHLIFHFNYFALSPFWRGRREVNGDWLLLLCSSFPLCTSLALFQLSLSIFLRRSGGLLAAAGTSSGWRGFLLGRRNGRDGSDHLACVFFRLFLELLCPIVLVGLCNLELLTGLPRLFCLLFQCLESIFEKLKDWWRISNSDEII